jgi:hypothetical protein
MSEGRFHEFPHLMQAGRSEFDMQWQVLQFGLTLERFLERTDFSDEDYPPEFRDLLHAVHRPLKRLCAYYHGEESPLSYVSPPPGRAFPKKESK